MHCALESPEHNAFVGIMEEPLDIPCQDRAAAVPFRKPVPDLFQPVVFGAPAFYIRCIMRKQAADSRIIFLKPHIEPASDYSFFVLWFIAHCAASQDYTCYKCIPVQGHVLAVCIKDCYGLILFVL